VVLVALSSLTGCASVPCRLGWAEMAVGAAHDHRTGLPQEVVDKRYGFRLVLVVPDSADGVAPGRPFYLGKFEVTQAEWERVMNANPSPVPSPACPVFPVSWNDASAFVSRIGYRLPSEAEWEYACRAGTQGARYGPANSVAWHTGNTGDAIGGPRGPQPVGELLPNTFGLHDMLGNVAEWCSAADDFGGLHVARGGGCFCIASDVVVSARFLCKDDTNDHMGLPCGVRLARDP